MTVTDGTRSTYTPEGWNDELTAVVGCIPGWFSCAQTVTCQSI